jgi:hypothetical protein
MTSQHTFTVFTERLYDLAARHDRAAADVTSAGRAIVDVDAQVGTTHGAVSSATAHALALVQAARADAVAHLAGRSRSLSENLVAAARRYDGTDQSSADRLHL